MIENKIKEIMEITLNNGEKSLIERGLKLAEESGECAQAILSVEKSKGCGYKRKNMEDVKEESIDTILVALSIFFQAEGSMEELEETLKNKIGKWRRVIE